jgi:hypothetical protein
MAASAEGIADPRIDALVALLKRYRTGLGNALSAVPVSVRNMAPGNDRWAVAQVLEHLAVTEHSVTRLFGGFLARAGVRADNEVFDKDTFEREMDLPFILDRSRKIIGPQPPDKLDAGEAWSALTDSRRERLTGLEQARGRRLEDRTRPHPATGERLNAYQWIAFIALHEGRHAAQIEAIGASLTGRDATDKG